MRSCTAQTKLEATKKQMGIPSLKLKQECPTRWNSCFDMLDRILKIKDALISTLALIRSDLSLQTSKWEIIEKVVPILQPFYEITREISSEKHVSLSKVLIFLQLMTKNIVKCKKSQNYSELNTVLNTMLAQIHTRFRDLEGNPPTHHHLQRF